jgi:membrane AbrB-like protein
VAGEPVRWSRRTLATGWALLFFLSGLLSFGLGLAGLPAAFLLGPMLAAIVLAVWGPGLHVPDPAFDGAQALVGCLIAASLDPHLLGSVAARWPIYLGTTAAILAASSVLGYALARWQLLPGTVGVWGATPGAAPAMVLMAEAFGSDGRLVAVMSYTRIVCVALVAALLAFALSGHRAATAAGAAGAAIDLKGLREALAVAAVGGLAGKLLRIPAGAFLGPLFLGAALVLAGLVHLSLPAPLLALSYAIIGWRIGLAYTKETVRAAGRALPRMLAAIFLLIGACACIGLLLARLTGMDGMTAFLATSPGGLDSVAIIAASAKVDLPFVMALQTVRFLGVLLVGPPLARFVARRQGAFAAAPEPLEGPP